MLKIDLSARHMDVTDAMRKYTQEKLGVMDRYLDRRISRIDVVAEVSAGMHIVEAIAHIDAHENVVVKKDEKDFYAAIDKLHDVLEKKLTQIKEKAQDKRRKSSRIATMESE